VPKTSTTATAKPKTSVQAATSVQAERERKAKEQHDAWVAKANDIAARVGVPPLVSSGVDFRIAYAKTLRPNGR
jgi:hypothetical protein